MVVAQDVTDVLLLRVKAHSMNTIFVNGVTKKTTQIAKRMNIQTLQRRIRNNGQR